MPLHDVEEARQDLVTTLSDTGYPVHAYEQPKVVAGSMILDEAEPFLEYGDIFGTLKINFDVYLFQDNRNGAAATKAMDEMVLAAVANLGDWSMTNLQSHYLLRLQEGGTVYLASKLSVQNILKIGA